LQTYHDESTAESQSKASHKIKPRLEGSQENEDIRFMSFMSISDIFRLPSETPTSEQQSEEQIKRAQSEFEQLFIRSIAHSDFDLGYSSEAEQLLLSLLERCGPYVREWINHLFLQLLDKPNDATAMLRIISHLDYDSIYPQGTTMAVAAMMHADPLVQEAAVRCFENWQDQSCVTILQSLNIREDWLKSYVEEVIQDLSAGEQRVLFDKKN